MALPLVCSLVFSSCGGSGGGDGDGDGEETIRPRTLDDISITLPGGIAFDFSRSVGTAPAISNGQTEIGSFVYRPGISNFQNYPNQGGTTSDTLFPDSLSDRTYTYQALNATSGIITLTGVAVNDLNVTGGFESANDSFTFFFHSDSSQDDLLEAPSNPTIQMNVTFNQLGATSIEISSLILSIVDSVEPEFDVTFPPEPIIALTDGGTVPINFNPETDPNELSAIVPESLNGLFLIFSSGDSNFNDNFSFQFVSVDATDPSSEIDEVGSGIQSIGFTNTTQPDVEGSAGVQYSWRRIPGTDNATLTFSNGAENFNGSYLLQYSSESSGFYTGTGPNNSGLSGTFIVRSSAQP